MATANPIERAQRLKGYTTPEDLAEHQQWQRDIAARYVSPTPLAAAAPRMKAATRSHLRPVVVAEQPTLMVEASLPIEPALTKRPARRQEAARVHAVADLLANPPAGPPVLIDGLISRGDRVLIAAPRGLGKSWFAMQLAQAIASGEGRFLDTFDILENANVLMLQGESSDHATARRWEMFGGSTRGIYVYNERDLCVTVSQLWIDGTYNGSRVRKQMTVAEISDGLEGAIRANNIGMLIIDPWAVFYRGEENSNDQVECALNELADLLTRTGVTIVLVHHFGKEARANAEPEDLGRGASRLADWAAVRGTMRPYFKPNPPAALQLSREDARRFVRMDFLTRDTVSPDSIVIEADPTTRRFGLCTNPPGGGQSPRPRQRASEIQRAVDACRDNGGFSSDSEAGRCLELDARKAAKLLLEAERLGLGVKRSGARGRGKASGWQWVGS